MERLYTLPEIARITGIPLAELEQYEREFADLLPRPRSRPAAVASRMEAAAREAAVAPKRLPEAVSWAERAWRRWRRWIAALRRLRWWPLCLCAGRMLLWWRKWRKGFEPA
jgi:hypothetical protein